MADTGVVLIYGGKWESMREKLLAVADTTERMGNSTIAEVAAIGRRASADLYRSADLKMGGTYWKSWVKNPSQQRGTYWDNTLGGYASRTKRINGRGMREMGFSFESKKSLRSKRSFIASVSKASMYSLTANLWEYSHNMGGYPERYRWSYDGSNWFSWTRGQVREARPFFMGAVKQRVDASVPQAINVVERKYAREFGNL